MSTFVLCNSSLPTYSVLPSLATRNLHTTKEEMYNSCTLSILCHLKDDDDQYPTTKAFLLCKRKCNSSLFLLLDLTLTGSFLKLSRITLLLQIITWGAWPYAYFWIYTADPWTMFHQGNNSVCRRQPF